jgi:hypothetical protein
MSLSLSLSLLQYGNVSQIKIPHEIRGEKRARTSRFTLTHIPPYLIQNIQHHYAIPRVIFYFDYLFSFFSSSSPSRKHSHVLVNHETYVDSDSEDEHEDNEEMDYDAEGDGEGNGKKKAVDGDDDSDSDTYNAFYV